MGIGEDRIGLEAQVQGIFGYELTTHDMQRKHSVTTFAMWTVLQPSVLARFIPDFRLSLRRRMARLLERSHALPTEARMETVNGKSGIGRTLSRSALAVSY
jgi:hypothetical protein